MSTVFDRVIDRLTEARKAATMEKSSFGFPHERIEIKSVHFHSEGGAVGDEVHPTDYIRKMVELYHRTWIIAPLDEAISTIRAQRDLIEKAERLQELLREGEIDEIIRLSFGCMEGGAE